MKRRLLGMLLSAAMLSALVMGCSSGASETEEAEQTEQTEQQDTQETKTVKIAGTAVSQVFYEAFKEKYEAMGYETEFIAFDSNPVCLEACASGEADISLGQQKKFVLSYNESNGSDLDMVKPYGMYTGIGLYSEKYASVDEIPDGSQIAVMNDATNEDVSLKILESAGLIQLSDDVEFATVADITDNPKNLEIIEMEQAQTVTALEDMAAACCWFTHMSASGKDPSTYLIRDDVMINYPMGVITNSEDLEAEWAVDMAECLRDPEVQDKIAETYPNVFEFYTSDDQVEE
ncbi:MAG: MetQ/NlpA family ABC transporter substrate-binding protein [Eubacteriales bacterium]|nr:MetQ/NlpA family ABC transporter substrate-binding protein [Eubacteriales bacterium]